MNSAATETSEQNLDISRRSTPLIRPLRRRTARATYWTDSIYCRLTLIQTILINFASTIKRKEERRRRGEVTVARPPHYRKAWYCSIFRVSSLLGLGDVGQEPMAQVFKKFQKNPYNYICFLSNTFRSITLLLQQ